MIQIIIQNGLPMVWNASDWLKIREESRIVGNLTGCLVGLPRQDTFQGLPLSLLHEEVTLLLEKNLAYIIDDTALSKPPDEKSKEQYLSYKESNKKEQMECYEKERQNQITSMIDKIIEGKRRKLLGLNTKKRKLQDESDKKEETVTEPPLELELNREEILKNELIKSADTFSPPLLVHTFTKEQWINESELQKIPWNFPETPQEKLRYCTFKDLWEKGLYITEGHKFGVDFLVYPGDPVKFHAQFLIVCIDYNDSLSSMDLISYARLGSISRKTFVIASNLPNNEDIIYQSIQWTEKN